MSVQELDLPPSHHPFPLLRTPTVIPISGQLSVSPNHAQRWELFLRKIPAATGSADDVLKWLKDFYKFMSPRPYPRTWKFAITNIAWDGQFIHEAEKELLIVCMLDFGIHERHASIVAGAIVEARKVSLLESILHLIHQN
jgi:hypothetical protein